MKLMKLDRVGRRDLALRGLSRSGLGERGAVAIIVAVSVFALVSFILLAVQVGTLGMVRAMLQGSADEAAMAGARVLDGTQQGLDNARIEANEMLLNGRNFPQGVNEGVDLSIAGDAFQTGIWDLEDPDAVFVPSNDPGLVNAVRVVGRKITDQNNPVKMFLGGAFGPDAVQVARTGIAAVGCVGSLPCKPELPLAACDNVLDVCDGGPNQKVRILQSPDPTDNGAWTGFSEVASARIVRDMINDCTKIPDDFGTGDCIQLNNGEIASADHDLRQKLDAFIEANPCPNVRLPDTENPVCEQCGAARAPDPVDLDGDGDVDENDCGLPVAIPVVPCGQPTALFPPDTKCSSRGEDFTGDSLNQARPIKSFVIFVITEVKDSGSPKWVDGYPLCGTVVSGGPTGPCGCGGSSAISCATDPILVNKDLRDSF